MAGSRTSSGIDTISRPTDQHNTSSLMYNSRKDLEANINQDDVNIALETFINSLQLNIFFSLDNDEQKERLSKIDALELFHAVQDINRTLAMTRLENYILKDFLEKNDPKLLIGLEQRRVTSNYQASIQPARLKETTQSVSSSFGRRTRTSISRSQITINTAGSQKKPVYDYKLNYRAKTDMAEKSASEVEKKILQLEKSATSEIKIMRGRAEEMRFICEETQETAKNFQLHFLRDESDLVFLNSATEKQLERKTRKFFNNWIKNARALLATMRLKITATQEHCQQLRNEFLTKSDLSGILTAIDFEKLQIKRTELLNSLEEKNKHMVGLKGVTAKASISLSEEKQVMMNIEEESKKLNIKTVEIIKAIGKLEKEACLLEAENEKDIETLKKLKMLLDHYEAPSVNQYIGKIDEVFALEKEEKMLKRKTYILNMKLNNMQRNCKMTSQGSIIINNIE